MKKRYLLSAAALMGISNVAHAEDGDLTMYGVTLYGTVDIGMAYQTHGTPLNDYFPNGIEEMIQKNSNKSVTTVAPSGMSQSKLGLKGSEDLIDGWSGLFKVEMGFDPTSGELSDGLKSLTQNNGRALNNQTSAGDSNRAGQPWEGAAYAGVSSPKYGTLIFGRQNGLVTDNITKYDPQGGSYAFSPIGYSGLASGIGSTEDARLDSSLRYMEQVGPFRAAGMYQFGNEDGGSGNAYEFDVGGDYDRLSVDATYGHKKDMVSASSLSAAQVNLLPGLGLSSNTTVAGTISDNTSYTIMGMYDAGAPKFYAGYEFIRYSNPSGAVPAGTTDIGGYYLLTTNNAYNNKRVMQISWTGMKYSFTPKFDLTGAYYRYDQNSYAAKSCSNASSAQCSGSLNAISLVADYKLTKRFDVYGGAMWSSVANGLASGYLNTATIDPMVGVRFSF